VLRHGANSGPGQTPAAPPSPSGAKRNRQRDARRTQPPAISPPRAGPPHFGEGPLERAVGNGAGRTSKGTQAHGRSERSQTGNGRAATTDSSAEQGLEADAPRTETRPGRTWQQGRPPGRVPRTGRQRRGGNGRSDAARLLTRGTLRRVMTASRGGARRPGGADSSAPLGHASCRNATNPRAGSGVQQTRGPAAEKAVEVVRDHAGGTRRRGLETPTRR
jgi:hypothetical protein